MKLKFYRREKKDNRTKYDLFSCLFLACVILKSFVKEKIIIEQHKISANQENDDCSKALCTLQP